MAEMPIVAALGRRNLGLSARRSLLALLLCDFFLLQAKRFLEQGDEDGEAATDKAENRH